MKELSIEEKAIAYDDALKRARKLQHDNAWVTSIFPELKESEDERIRKAMISGMAALKEQGKETFATIPLNDCIDWLEKEGKQNSVNADLDELVIQLEETIGTSPHSRETIKDFFQKAVQKYMNCLKIATGEIGALVEENYRLKEKQGEQNPYSGVSFKYNGHTFGMCARDGGVEILMDRKLKAFVSQNKSVVYPNHPQSSLAPKSALDAIKEEKVNNANKIEPKFKIGDFIINDYCFGKVIALTDGAYLLDSGQGIPFSCEHNAHLWTLEDARDGDVLNSVRVQATIIFKGFADDGKHILSYCALQKGIFISQELLWDRDFEPASNFWKNSLYAATKAKGYEWDANKKELKKIEDEEYNGENYGIDSLYHAQRILEKTLGKVDGYQSDDGILEHKCAISAVKKLYEQNPAWSEEYEYVFNKILNWCVLVNPTSSIFEELPKDKFVERLKSLKCRYT